MPRTSTSRATGSPTPAVDRAFQILEYLATISPEAGVTEMANALDINKSTCYNILQSMSATGVVVRDSRFPVYRLGPKLVELGTASRRNFSHRDDVKQLVRPLVEKFGITCLTAQPLPGYRGFVVTDRYLPRGEDILSAPIGHVYPINAPAMGRVFLAFEDIHGSAITPADFGLRTKAELDALLRGADEARDDGYGRSLGEQNEGVNAVAAPVRGTDGRVNFLLCVFGYTEHFPDDQIDEVGTALRELADQISYRVQGLAGYSDR